MTNTVLTDEQIRDIAVEVALHDQGGLARAIEQAVLQSEQVQAMRKDAERWGFARDVLSVDDIEQAVENMRGSTPDPDESAKADAAIDHARRVEGDVSGH